MLACSALAGAAGVLTARPPAAQALREGALGESLASKLVPPYPDAVFFPMGGRVHVDGRPRELAYALTQDSPRKVAERYAAIFTSQGLRVEQSTLGEEEWVTATAPNEPYVRTVAAVRRHDGTAIIASASLVSAPEAAARRVPMPPACTTVSSTGAKDAGEQTEAVELDCDGRVEDVLAFYDRLLAGSERSEATLERGVFVRYRDTKLEVTLSAVQEEGAPPKVGALVHWQERR